jgi:hypothetical protein
MAKLTFLDCSIGEKRIRVEIKINTAGTFSIIVPEDLSKAAGVSEVKALTFDKVKEDFLALINKIKNEQTTTERVIVSQWRAAGMYNDRDGDFVENWDSLSFSEGVGFCISAGVYDRITVGKVVRFESVKSGIPAYFYPNECRNQFMDWQGREVATIIPWTQTREDFFREVYFGLCGMIKRVQDFMEGGKEQVAIRIDTASGRLISGPEGGAK